MDAVIAVIQRPLIEIEFCYTTRDDIIHKELVKRILSHGVESIVSF